MNRKLIIFAGISLLMTASSFGKDADVTELDCLIEPHVVIDISSAVEGTINLIRVEKSDFVKEGQVLAELDSVVEKANVALAEARATMKGEVMAREKAFEFGQRKRKRIDELFKKNAVSLNQRDEVETEAILAELALQQANEAMQLAELELSRARKILSQRTVRSPINGVVVDRFKSPGEFLGEEPILRLAQIDPLKVEVIVPASLFGTIKKGATAQVIPEAPMDQAYQAKVSIVDRVVDASSGTFGVRLELPNPDHRLPGGLKCRVRFVSP